MTLWRRAAIKLADVRVGSLRRRRSGGWIGAMNGEKSSGPLLPGLDGRGWQWDVLRLQRQRLVEE